MIDTTPTYQQEPYHVLFADTFEYRHRQFRVRQGNSKRWPSVRHCHSTGEFLLQLKERNWDIVFIPGYFDKKDDFKEIIRNVAELAARGWKPGLIIFHGMTDDHNLCGQLSAIGLLTAHVPWDFTTPSVHKRQQKDFKREN